MSGTVVVWKYPLSRAQRGELDVCCLPIGARVVHFAFQGDMPTLWAEHLAPTDQSLYVLRRFLMVGTGQEVDRDRCRYIGTTIVGAFVWHLCEVTEGDEP